MDIASLFPKKKPDIGKLLQEKDFRGLIGALRFPDVKIQKEAAAALGTLGPEAAGSLLAALKTKDTVMKLGVIEALGKIREARAVEPLIACLNDESNEVRWVAATGQICPVRGGLCPDPDRLEACRPDGTGALFPRVRGVEGAQRDRYTFH